MVREPIRLSRSETLLAWGEVEFRRAGACGWAAEPPTMTAEVGACRGQMDAVIDGRAVGGVAEPNPRCLMVLEIGLKSDGRDPFSIGRACPVYDAADVVAWPHELVAQQSVEIERQSVLDDGFCVEPHPRSRAVSAHRFLPRIFYRNNM